MSFLRNIPFGVTGVIVVILFFITGNTGGYNLWRMGIAIIISFSCYVPVTVLAKRYPPIGALMIPKTCAYIWMIMLLLGLLP
jgi:phosphoglycerol transferase MdoB-like AlkP superfamily enzyme